LEQTADSKKEGKLEAAADRYKIPVKVLKDLSRLTSTVGDERMARKYEAGAFRPFTEKEIQWLQEVMKIIIRRAGEKASGTGKLDEIDMSQLPPLT
jgi:hypothetical protein